jgi:hypothetical protein
VRVEDGRRTREYVNLEAAQRAAARGEVYTDEEYEALTRVVLRPTNKRKGKR